MMALFAYVMFAVAFIALGYGIGYHGGHARGWEARKDAERRFRESGMLVMRDAGCGMQDADSAPMLGRFDGPWITEREEGAKNFDCEGEKAVGSGGVCNSPGVSAPGGESDADAADVMRDARCGMRDIVPLAVALVRYLDGVEEQGFSMRGAPALERMRVVLTEAGEYEGAETRWVQCGRCEGSGTDPGCLANCHRCGGIGRTCFAVRAGMAGKEGWRQ